MTTTTPQFDRVTLNAQTAADLMNADVRSIDSNRSAAETLGFLTKHGYGAAPVIDDAGRPVGVVSLWDIVAHQRDTGAGSDKALARDLMTPSVFSVTRDTPAHKAISHIIGLNVHHLFVVGDDGVLVGVISALDVLRHLDVTGR